MGCIFDYEQGTLDLGSDFYDFETNDWNEELNKKFSYDLVEPNVLILQSIEILPDFRGKYMGYRFIKDFIINFAQAFGIVPVNKEPSDIQTNIKEKHINDSFTKTMNYQNMISDDEEISYILLHYFAFLGFQYFPELNVKYLLMCTAHINEKLAKVEFDL